MSECGYICKRCGGASPVGVGYVANGVEAAQASEGLTRCACGYSVSPDVEPDPLRLYSTRDEAIQRGVVEPIQAGLDAGEDARELFDVEAIADAVVLSMAEWFPAGRGYVIGCSPEEFWAIVQDNARPVVEPIPPYTQRVRVTVDVPETMTPEEVQAYAAQVFGVLGNGDARATVEGVES